MIAEQSAQPGATMANVTKALRIAFFTFLAYSIGAYLSFIC